MKKEMRQGLEMSAVRGMAENTETAERELDANIIVPVKREAELRGRAHIQRFLFIAPGKTVADVQNTKRT